jgi:bacterioferritin (cytochrome b1)
MRGNKKVIAALNEALREELTAINQYFLHAEMCESWGYHKLSAVIRKSSIEEMRHAESVIERLLFLDAEPKMEYLELNVGANVKAQLEADLKLEQKAIAMNGVRTMTSSPGSRIALKSTLRPPPAPTHITMPSPSYGRPLLLERCCAIAARTCGYPAFCM